MSDDLNCLGQTPAQAADFDAVCAAHDELLLKALEPFKRPTLLHGHEDENRVVLMPLYPHQIRAIQQYFGVVPTYYKP